MLAQPRSNGGKLFSVAHPIQTPMLTDASAIAFEIFKPPRQISEGC
jgi:hypothetical protein